MRRKTMQGIILAAILCLCFIAVPVYAVKTAEQSLGGSITRGSRFAVTITGIPNSSYYIWIPHTSSMTGEPHDQPPFIADSQANVVEDSPDGPYIIGSYQFNNGGGTTIREDVAQSTPEMPNTQYYALVTTDSRGLAIVEFRTSFNTALRSFSIKVENPRSIDSDTLLVGLNLYSRGAPVSIEAQTPERSIPEPTPRATENSVLPATTLTTLTTAPPLPTTSVPPIPSPTTRRASAGFLLPVLAAGAAIISAGKRR